MYLNSIFLADFYIFVLEGNQKIFATQAMKKLRAIIVDDETNAQETLFNLLRMTCENVEVCGTAKNVDEAITLIHQQKPDLVFLDIQMPEKTGFDLLKSFSEINFGVIFTTAYQEYAVKAFRFSAIDYLLKPIDPDELVVAVQKYQNQITKIEQAQLQILQHQFENQEPKPQKERKSNENQRIALPAAEGIHIVELTDIIQCESMGSYTKFHLKNGQKLVVSRLLKEFEEILDNYQFFRVHQSNIVNLQYIKRYVKGDGGQVWMSDNEVVEVSRRRKDEFLELFSNLFVNSAKLG